jgi:hypothetical protein
MISYQTQGTYIANSDPKDQSKDDITANVLVLDAKSLCLQGANSDGESNNEVEKDQGWVSVTDGLDGKPELQLCQSFPWMVATRSSNDVSLQSRIGCLPALGQREPWRSTSRVTC